MHIDFVKYHGAGNDFIMIDQRNHIQIQRTDIDLVAFLCHRRFGIGGDGLILLQKHDQYGIEMVYFNADGRESTLCGNGGRCFTAFAKHLGIAADHFRFLAIDGPHDAVVTAHPDGQQGHEWVELQMNDLNTIECGPADTYILNTGSPHYVQFVNTLSDKDMVAEGRAVRYSERFKAQGINVNLAEVHPDGHLNIRTYERGVEDETLACGTGVTAAAIAQAVRNGLTGPQYIPVQAAGGALAVRFNAGANGQFTDIWLCGPAQRVFTGQAEIG